MDYTIDAEVENLETDVPVAHQAAAAGQTDTLTRAIRADPTLLEHQDSDGLTPLAHSVMAEQLDSAKLLVKMGASINCEDSLGRTCLSMAAYQGWHAGVVFLLRNGARQQISDKAGRVPLHSATYDTGTKVLSALLQGLPSNEVDQPDNEGSYPEKADMKNLQGALQALVRSLPLLRHNRLGMTALHWACFHNRPSQVDLLLQTGATVHSQDIDGKTPLHWAAQNGSIACCRRLLLHTDSGRANLINKADYSGKTILHLAGAAGHDDVITFLGRYAELSVEAQDPDNRTALHWAAATGQAAALSALLRLNANPRPVDSDNGTPLDYARQSGHQDCVQILEAWLGTGEDPCSDADLVPGARPHLSSDTAKVKKSPLGFIAELFRPRKTRGNPVDLRTYDNQTSSKTPAGSGESSNSAAIIPPGSGAHHATTGARSANTQLSMVRCQNESDMLISLEKLYVSREDNPLTTVRKKNNNYELGEIQASHSSNVALGVGRQVLPPRGSEVDHSHLIQNSSLALQRGGPPAEESPGLGVWPVGAVGLGAGPGPEGAWPQERDHGRLEENAATILALSQQSTPSQLSHPQLTAALPPSTSLAPIATKVGTDLNPLQSRRSPIVPPPGLPPSAVQGEPRVTTSRPNPVQLGTHPIRTHPVQLGTHSVQLGTHPIRTHPVQLGAHPVQLGTHSVQLAPIKGPLPPPSPHIVPPYQPVNRQLTSIRQAPSGSNRTPTPPPFTPGRQVVPSENQGQLRASHSSIEHARNTTVTPQRKKRRKKKSMYTTDTLTAPADTEQGNHVGVGGITTGLLTEGNSKSSEAHTEHGNVQF